MNKQFDAILEKWDLLKHPFYQAWSAGTLPLEALKVYAREYGAFIGTLHEGWNTLNDAATADEEREHTEMWKEFASALGAKVGEPEITQVAELVRVAHELFASSAAALGAMYAFEAQQPETAKSKLHGLKTHYALPSAVEAYFEVHSTNWRESEKIMKQIKVLSAQEKQQALAACEKMAASLWDALTGIHDKTC